MDSAINRFLGIEAEDLPDGNCRLKILVRKEYENETGITHGGIAALLVDGAMGRSVLRQIPEGQTAATVQLSLQYLRPAKGRLVAEGKVVQRGKRMAFVQGECRNEAGELVVLAQGTWVVRPIG